MIDLRKIALGLFVGTTALGMASTSVNANTITMEDYGINNTVECVQGCMAFIETGVGDEISVSDTTAHEFPQAGNPDAELAALNDLLALFDPARDPVVGVNKTDSSGNGFTTNSQYFSIKQGNNLWFFENTSGGSLTVDLGADTNDYSHWTEYGPMSAVPVPAAAWLFGTALIGFIGFSRRTKV
jgi:hypothetical protein